MTSQHKDLTSQYKYLTIDNTTLVLQKYTTTGMQVIFKKYNYALAKVKNQIKEISQEIKVKLVKGFDFKKNVDLTEYELGIFQNLFVSCEAIMERVSFLG